ncbi:hypothetical protein GW17_00040545 [Ensete ventricosum]|nr:hypothetical protein GW17_00040545 [Ensete ventricosum]
MVGMNACKNRQLRCDTPKAYRSKNLTYTAIGHDETSGSLLKPRPISAHLWNPKKHGYYINDDREHFSRVTTISRPPQTDLSRLQPSYQITTRDVSTSLCFQDKNQAVLIPD